MWNLMNDMFGTDLILALSDHSEITIILHRTASYIVDLVPSDVRNKFAYLTS